MAINLSDMKSLVEAELENKVYSGTATATGDGETGVFIIAPHGYSLLASSVSVYKNGTLQEEDSEYVLDLTNGVVSLMGLPVEGDELFFEFQYKSFSDEVLEEAIRAGVQALFPAFYVADISSAVTDGEAYEFALASGTEFVTKMEFKGSGTTDRYYTLKRDRYEVNREYDTDTDEEVISVHFYTPPSVGTLRAHTICRPVESAGTWSLPERAVYPAATYACYHLITQKMAPRVRSDVAVATQGQDIVYPVQMKQASDAFLMRFQFQTASSKMPTWSAV